MGNKSGQRAYIKVNKNSEDKVVSVERLYRNGGFGKKFFKEVESDRINLKTGEVEHLITIVSYR